MAVQDKPRSKPFALTQLNGKISNENDQLYTDLKYLDGYYDKIQVFFMVADTAKQNPNDVEVWRGLRKMEDELCSDDTLLTYLHAAIGALRALASVAKETETYISSVSGGSSKLSDEESGVLKLLLKEVKSISKHVKDDFFAEVNPSPGQFGKNVKYWDVSARRQSLRAAGIEAAELG